MPSIRDQTLTDVDEDIAEAEATLSRLRAHRRRVSGTAQPEAAVAAITRAASLGVCALPPLANQSLDLTSALYRESAERAPPWCPARLDPPTASSLSALGAARGRRPGGVAVPVLPSLLAPCCAHSGTTFLWKCLSYALHPDKVCSQGPPPGRRPSPRHASDAPFASNWSSAACGSRKFLLPGLTGNINGHWDYRKEWFFYGGGGASFAKGWDDYVGIELPLCYWERGFQIHLRESPLADTLAQSRRHCVVPAPAASRAAPRPSTSAAAAIMWDEFERARKTHHTRLKDRRLRSPPGRRLFFFFRRAQPPKAKAAPQARPATRNMNSPAPLDGKPSLNGLATTYDQQPMNSPAQYGTRPRNSPAPPKRSINSPAPGQPCIHRTCLPYDAHKIKFGPRYSAEAAAGSLGRIQFQPTKALPRLDPVTHPGAVVPDLTPNYLCSSTALRNVVSTVGTPAHWKMIIVHRSPYDALRSSYKMFVQWGWVRSDNLTADVALQLTQLRQCNATLYDDPAALGRAPDTEILRYFTRCWSDGVWKRFVTNSLHYVCLRAWLAAGFERSQFLLVKNERLRTMTAHELLSGVSRFTGLHYNERALQSRPEEFRAQCEAADSTANREAAARRNRGRSGSVAMINSHSAYTGNNAEQRSRLAKDALQEFERLAETYVELMDGLGLRQL